MSLDTGHLEKIAPDLKFPWVICVSPMGKSFKLLNTTSPELYNL